MRKLRSRLEGRRESFRRMRETLARLPLMTMEDIANEIGKLRCHSVQVQPKKEREEAVTFLAVELARRIVDAP